MSNNYQIDHNGVTLQAPMVHLNGSGKDSLQEQYQAINNACADLLGALRVATPHGRDYYPLGADAYPAAREQHEARVRKVLAVKAEIEALWYHLAGG
jgi:hypothetical protein